jgi:alkanesulfonate monooxygenase SsuD/methylene tetrahydromethanopterin reductase-like flavin-dependent oxidoreductase (luciferase family)
MADQHKRPAPLFGASLTPSARNWEQLLRLGRVADELGLDILAVQDHPYNPDFLDTWTLLSVIGGQTERITLMPDVSPLPLRPPVMFAKAAASLDVLTGGRAEMGLGAGAYWDAIVSYGGRRLKPGEAVEAVREGIEIMRLLWDTPASRPIDYAGKYFDLTGANAGPAPVHRIGISVGAAGPKMLRLVGELADGWVAPLAMYLPPEKAVENNRAITEAAEAAGRDPGAIRRFYNLPGVVLGQEQTNLRPSRPNVIVGPASHWIDEITGYYHNVGMDSFIFWPAGGNEEEQIRHFAEEVAPGVRARVAG